MIAGVLALTLIATTATTGVVYGGYKSLRPAGGYSQPVKKPTPYHRPHPNPRRR